MTHFPGLPKHLPNVLLMSLAISTLSNASVLWIFGTSLFKFYFGELRYIYYAIVVSAVWFAISIVSLTYPSRRIMWVFASTILGYVASVVSYFLLTLPFLPERLASGHWETLLLIWILPLHGLFILTGLITGVVTIGTTSIRAG